MKIMFIWIPAGMNIYGGGEKVLSILCRNLTERNNKISILSFVNMKKITCENDWVEPFSIYRKNVDIGYLNGPYLLKYRRSEKYIESSYLKNKPEVIIISGNPFMIMPTIRFLKKKNVHPSILYWDHGFLSYFFAPDNIKNGLYNIFWKKISKKYLINSLRNINNFFYISNGIGDIVKQINPEANIYFTPNPVENATSKTNKEYNKSSNPIKSLLYVGRLDDKPKNISFLLKGLSKSKSGWKLTIIGDGPDRQKLEHLADILGIPNNITWTGFKKEPFSDIREIDALILTSRYEGLPTVLIEANQNGIPFISSNCLSGPEDIVIPGINGHLFSEGNLSEFIASINRLIDGKLLFAPPEEIIKTTLRYSEDNTMKLFFNALEQVTEYKQKIQQNESKENV